MEALKRKSAFPIDPLFLKRQSSRALSSTPLTHQELMTLFEAARWAPSSYNNQPWRFVYALQGTPFWHHFFNLLAPSNQKWVQNAAALVVLVSAQIFEHNNKPSRTHSFDAGAAWENLALQAVDMGLIAHAMEGFDYDKARSVLSIPDNYTVEAMIAIGYPGNKEELPADLQAREQPSNRKPLDEIVFQGHFGKKITDV